MKEKWEYTQEDFFADTHNAAISEKTLRRAADDGEISEESLKKLAKKLGYEDDWKSLLVALGGDPNRGQHHIESPMTDFVGREDDLNALRAKLRDGNVHLTSMRGMGGIGKTQMARKLAASLNDGSRSALEIDLKGASATVALTPEQVLIALIRSLTKESDGLPDSVDKLEGMWQDCLRRRPVLLLLDNARDAVQVIRALPKSAGHKVIITSRAKFSLPGVLPFEVIALTEDESCELLQNIKTNLGDDDAKMLAKECSYLPLALRLAGSFLANRETLPAATYIKDLRSRRLALLDRAADECGESSITATLSLSYNWLSEELKRRWRSLGVFPDSFDTAAASAVWAMNSVESATELNFSTTDEQDLAELNRLSLLNWSAKEKRYSLHDLAREFARSSLNLQEVFDSSLRHANFFQVLHAKLDQEAFTEIGVISRTALNSFQRELVNITAGWEWSGQQSATGIAAARIHAEYANNSGELMAAFVAPSHRHKLYSQSVAVIASAVYPRAAMMAQFSLARAMYDRGDKAGSETAAAILATVVGDATTLGEIEAAVNAQMFYGRHFRRIGDNKRAIREHELAVTAARSLLNPRVLAKALSQLTRTQLDCDQVPAAEISNGEALAISKKLGYSQYVAGCLLTSSRIISSKAATAGRQGNPIYQRELTDQSIEMQEDAVTEARNIGTLKLLNIALFSLGRSLRFRNQGDDRLRALTCFEESLKLNKVLGNIRAEAGACHDIGETLRMLDRHDEAIRVLNQALDLQKQAENKLGEAETLEGLIKLLLRSDPIQAEAYLKRCREIYSSPELRRYKRQWDDLERWVKGRRQRLEN